MSNKFGTWVKGNAGKIVDYAIQIGGAWLANKTAKDNMERQKQQNEADRNFELQMYDKKRADALADRDYENRYNHPSQVMQRLKEAGLNPNFVYGNSAQSQSVSTSPVSGEGGSQPAPKYDTSVITDASENYFRNNLLGAQTNNVQQNTEVQMADKALKDAQMLKTLSDTELTDAQVDQVRSLKDGLIEKQKLENEALKVNTIVMLNRDEREELANSNNIALTTQKILESKLQQAIMRKNISMTSLERQKLEAEIAHLEMLTDVLNHKGAVDRFNSELINKGYNPNMPGFWNEILRSLDQLVDPE